MKYIDEYRDPDLAKKIVADIKNEVDPNRQYRFMEFCGGHTHAFFRFGVPDLLPDNLKLVHGPGCPVCVLPMSRLDLAIELAEKPNVILCSYGDMMRVPGSGRKSLLTARSNGADVRMVYSALDAIRLAQENPQREVVFFGIGFETTTPPSALLLKQAEKLGIENLSLFCNHLLTPSAIASILDSPEIRDLDRLKLDGFLGPAHVSTVIGCQPFEYFASEYQKPVVIAGFEPVDLLQAVLMLVRQVNDGRHEIENEYARAVTHHGNQKAKAIVAECFELKKTFEWRGLGYVPYSGLKIKKQFSKFDAEVKFSLQAKEAKENRACECPGILRGVKEPQDCKLFGKVCTPDHPIGACMVSSEGACAAWYRYRRNNM
ncbi:hydrogenase formation protein HypD [Pelagibaculum spongiae]|uniref:Hydrogenase maturation factor n=1 Tax=Pelagibaculum spongiae TaxID=2080658 RepID=A0A2V1GZJ7_9GAMM|nr:hydrogenase formation protein HypD [Pelagibaculum spongiae]PVZ68802.1 hydrogenase formation protein HypD [Pelagibaculum spongiae]